MEKQYRKKKESSSARKILRDKVRGQEKQSEEDLLYMNYDYATGDFGGNSPFSSR